MIERMILTLEIFTYFALLPIVYRSLMSVDFSKIFKKNHIGEIRIVYFLITILITKVVADFFIDITRLTLTIVGVINN